MRQMMHDRRRRGRAALLAGLLCAGLLASAGAEAAAAGKVTVMRGRITAATADGEVRALRRGSVIRSGDTLNTSHASFVKLKFTDGSGVYLRQNSRFRVDEFRHRGRPKRDRSFFSLVRGGMRFLTGLIGNRNRAAFRIKTPLATIGIRGTDGQVLLCQDDCALGVENGLYLQTNLGEIVLNNPQGEVTTPAGQFAFVCANCAPEPVATQPQVFQVEFFPGVDTPDEPPLEDVCR